MSFNDLGIGRVALMLLVFGAASTYPQSCQVDLNQLQQNQTAAQSAAAAAPSGSSVSRTGVPETCPALIDGPPRGLACLQCMHPRAREQAEQIALLLRRSCLKNVALNYLVDGTFAFDESVLREHIALLTENNRQLYLHLYLSNGPAQRRGGSNSENVFGIGLEPERFRSQILRDPDLQSQFKQLVTRLIPVLRDAEAHGAQVSLVPMLEDNLTKESFAKMTGLIFDALPDDLSVAIGRSPCTGCGTGSDADRPTGVFLESHSIRDASRLTSSLITNDGDAYSFSGGDGLLSIQELRSARDEAERRQNVFILWSAERQGFTVGENGQLQRKPADERNYALISPEEQSMLIDFLREGLSVPQNWK
ncbi:MAG: hypothetical protein U0136_20325 [Bdellovibrionota bacterium]